MPNRYQQESVRRKRVYLALILVFFAVNTFLWRGVEWFDRRAFGWTITEQANRLGAREQNLGEVKLTDQVAWLTLTGSRGAVVCALWVTAEEKKKKHEWNQLELVVNWLLKLQPHFSGIWLYQSHNLAYNVSVELEEGRDQYHYIFRGFQLLHDGTRRLKDNPDLRYMMGWYYQHKLGISDDKNLLQALFQLSCIDPRLRDPQRFLGPDGQVNLPVFEQFCREHPQLVRRLRERLDCRTPAEVVRFLGDNYQIPCRYEEPQPGLVGPAFSRLKPMDERFPFLPEPFEGPEANAESAVGDNFTNYDAARSWFAFSQLPLPPAQAMPGPRSRDYDPQHPEYIRGPYRRPRQPPLLSFRRFPAIAQTNLAEKLQKDGWCDAEGWAVDEGQGPETQWFPGHKVIVGAGRDWSGDAWRKALAMWQEVGQQNGFLVAPETLGQWEQLAARYRATYRVEPEQVGPDLDESQRGDGMGDSFDAHRRLYWYRENREFTSFPRFLHEAEANSSPEALKGRKHIFQAEQWLNRYRIPGREREPAPALREYEQAIPLWRSVLLQHREFSRSVLVQEEAVHLQDQYRVLVQEVRRPELKQLLVLQDYLTNLAAGTPYLPSVHARLDLPIPVPIMAGPLDNLVDAKGERVITDAAIQNARSR